MKSVALLTLFTIGVLSGGLQANPAQHQQDQDSLTTTTLFTQLPINIEANIGSGQGTWQDR